MNRRPVADGSPADVNLLAVGTTVEGTVRTKGDMRISGRLIGELHVDGRAIVTSEGTVKGNIYATSAEIGGRVEGDLHVGERLVLKETADYNGHLRTKKLIIEEGAIFTGRCEMGDQKTTAPTRAVAGRPAEAQKSPGEGQKGPAEGQKGPGEGQKQTSFIK